MAVAQVGTYPKLVRSPAPVAVPMNVRAAGSPWTPDAYGVAAATPQQFQAQSTGFNWVRVGAWAAGAFAAFKLVIPQLGQPGGLVTAAVLGAGAWVGNKVYNMVTGQVAMGDAGKYLSWAGGGFAAFKFGRPMLGRSPSGLLLGAIVIAGAWGGGKIYNMVTGR